MTDQQQRLARLRRKRDQESDPDDRADLDAAIAALENELAAQAGARQVALSDESQVATLLQGDVQRDLRLFTGETYGNYFAETITLVFQQPAAAPPADYEAALRRYLDDLYVRHATLDLRGIDEQRPVEIPLSDIFISLTLREPPPEALRGRGAVRRFLDADTPPPLDAGAPQRRVDWPEALREQDRLAVIGRPGSGKTTLLHYTAVRLAEALARDEVARLTELGLDVPLVPLLLPLRELGSYLHDCGRREVSGNSPRLLLDCLANYYNGRNLDLPADFFSRLCEEGRAILLLDGLDEVSRSDDRALVSGILSEFVGRYHRCRYVVSARVAAYTGAAELGAGFVICTVDDLSPEQQQAFIANWSRCVHSLVYRRGSPEQIGRMAEEFNDGLQQAMRRNPGVGRLAPNPLLLTVIAIVYFNRQDRPENRAQLYEECVNVLLRGGRGKVDRAGQERAQLLMGLEARRELLAAVACAMHQGGEQRKQIERTDLERLLTGYLRRRTTSDVEAGDLARDFIKELPVHLGLFDEVDLQRFGFSHLSFQEFLTARHIAETDTWNLALDRFQESWWREVIMLCAGHLSQERCWRFLEQLSRCGATPAEQAQALLLAAETLVELERFKGQGPIRAEIQAAARRIIEQQPADAVPAAARVRCGRALAHVGDPRPGVCTLPPAMVTIRGGSFVIGSSQAEADAAGPEYAQAMIDIKREDLVENAKHWPQDEVNNQALILPDFELARYPITNAQYQRFIEAGGYEPAQPWWDAAGRAWLAEPLPEPPDDGWPRRRQKDAPEFWDDVDVGIACPNHPVVGICWYEAMAFCRWLTEYLADGYIYRLPSEAEWEYAARGAARRRYAWGDQPPDAERACFKRNYDYTIPVGCLPSGATPDGLFDMTGNVWEWTCSVFRPYPYDPQDGREDASDPAQKHFTLRGGAWHDLPIYLRAALRGHYDPADRNYNLGLRLARHPRV